MGPDNSQPFGIHELYRPGSGVTEVDIVAVHGLNGDAFRTWTAKSNDVCWLSHPDFLPKFIKRARILTWGYNANVSSLKSKTTSSDRILQHAQTLIAQLHADRDLEDANNRPIIFLCHSLGGIIVKRALAYSASRTAPKIAHLGSIYTCTYGLLFFGTPHSGANKARLLGSLQKLAALATPKAAIQFESSLLNALEQESETLQNITDQFTPLMANFRIFFFWEQEKLDLKYTKEYIVEESSAAPMVDGTERCGIAADHREMCQFDRNTLQGFRTAVSALKRYCLDAPSVIEGRCMRAALLHNDNLRFEALTMLRSIQTWPARSDESPSPRSDLGRAWTIQGDTGRLIEGRRSEEMRFGDLSAAGLQQVAQLRS